MKYKKTTLPNGLRIITIPTNDNPSVTVMVLSETGSNYESKAQNGLSHFLEHMVFKGTAARPTFMDIALDLENIGAESNAFTSHEYTGYYAKAENRHFDKLLDVVSDIYLNPTFPEATLEKERGVILQEINLSEDLPQRKVWDVLHELLYGDSPAGRTILGPKDNIRNFSRKDFVKYRDSHYTAEKTLVVISGDVESKEAVKSVKKYFKNIPSGKKLSKARVAEKQKAPALSVYKKKTDQTHIVLAFRGFKASDKRSVALLLLSYIMGKGFSSRLFQKMREEMGACYYVSSDIDEYTDHGVFAISAGIESKRIGEVVQALIGECQRFTNEEVPKEELDKAKEYYIGHLYMSLETSDSLANFYADQEISGFNLKTPQDFEKEIRAITAKDVQKVARDIFKDEKMNLAVVGDVKDSAKIGKILHF
jgi:predicted Zn-dependent peptidase